jgi:hypothetical protein
MRFLVSAVMAAACLTGAALATPSEAGRTEFEVLRNGQPFGRHTVVVSGTEASLRAQSRVALRATAGPLTVFRLEQTCSETWTNGVLVGLSCSTLKDGRRTQVRAERQDNRLVVRGAEGEHVMPVTALPASWWTRPPEGAMLINTETGEPMRVRVTHMGREGFQVGGRRIQADRVRVQGDTMNGDLWYDAEGRWVGCTFTARGQRIQYRLASPVTSAPA